MIQRALYSCTGLAAKRKAQVNRYQEQGKIISALQQQKKANKTRMATGTQSSKR